VTRRRLGAADVASLDAGVRRSALASGVRVLTDEVPAAASASVTCWVGVGSRDEPVELAGASHFLEHLLFKGTRDRTAREINRAVDAVGGEFNAYTTREATVFYLRVPASERPLALDLLSEVVTRPALDADDVEVERHVILEELDAAVDTPEDLVFMELAESIFPDHPLGREVLGRPETIRRMDRDGIAEFHRRWYRPPNLVVAAAGAIGHDELVDASAGFVLDAEVGASPRRAAPASELRPVVVVHRPHEQAHLAWGWRAFPHDAPQRYAAAVLSHALGDGPSSRLYEEVRERRGLAYSVASSLAAYADAGTFTIYCATAPEHVEEVRSIVEGTLSDIAADGIDDDELAVAQGYLVGSLLLGMEDTGVRMSRLAAAESTRGRAVTVAEAVAGIEAVDADAVRSVAAGLIATPAAVAAVGPRHRSLTEARLRWRG